LYTDREGRKCSGQAVDHSDESRLNRRLKGGKRRHAQANEGLGEESGSDNTLKSQERKRMMKPAGSNASFVQELSVHRGLDAGPSQRRGSGRNAGRRGLVQARGRDRGEMQVGGSERDRQGRPYPPYPKGRDWNLKGNASSRHEKRKKIFW